MNWLFDAEKPFMRSLSAIADLIILNFLTLLCSLPIVTAGAAITALYSVSIRLVRREESSLMNDFFHSFRSNFKNATLLFIILLLCAGVLYFDYLAAKVYIPILCYAVAAIGILVIAVALYLFALLARYENTLAATAKNALLLAVGYFPKTLAMTVFTVCFWTLSTGFIRYGAPFLLMFGFSLPVYVCCILINSILNQLENKKG